MMQTRNALGLALSVLATLAAVGLSIGLMAAQQTTWALGVLSLALLGCLAALLVAKDLAASNRSFRESKAHGELLTRQLAQQREAVDALADGLDIAIFLCDGKGVIQYANRIASELFRFENPVGRPILAVTLSHDLEQLVTETAGDHTPHRTELTFTYPEERVALVQAWGEPPDWERVFLSIYDITELRRLERIRQDFVANVSHEVRTPMTTIRAMSETLIDDDGQDRELLHRYLERIISEVDRLTTIAQDLLVLSSAESGVVRKQTCDVGAVVRSVVSMLMDKATKKGLHLSYSGPKHLWIEANPAQMSQVFMNLIDNAINYTPQGQVEVEILEGGDSVTATVRDTGVGIEAEHLPRIFERFYRVDKGRSRATGGTGLGLSIVRHIVEGHGGRVGVESKLGEGTSFTISLPVGEIGEPTNA
ncbi:MAG: hypothetical protein K1X67_04415 [Fimbriimonadaceae bacterium]|nr:hypothetical protein [Fimbriimonadaceae bacterium]